MTALLFFWLMNCDIGRVVLPSTDVYHPLTNKTTARSENGIFFVFDRFEHRILMFQPGDVKGRIIARKGLGPGELDRTNRIFIFDKALYVLSSTWVQVFNIDGSYRRSIRLPPGLMVDKTATGWLGKKLGLGSSKMGLYHYDQDIKNPQTLVEWMEDAPRARKIVPGKKHVVPLYIERGERAVSKDGERVYYRLPNSSKIVVYSIGKQQIMDEIHLGERYPFHESVGMAHLDKLRKDLPGTRVTGVFPEYFPYTNGIRVDMEGCLLVKRMMGKKAKVLRYNSKGNPIPAPFSDMKDYKRVVGVQGGFYFISFQNERDGDMGVSKVPKDQAEEFIKNHPVEE
ncbi:MAG: hypothetical protein QNK37_16430 [Acidobacteriota bacterium]|nr:hypothetical protein [Acidobacteriota bacterium]